MARWVGVQGMMSKYA